MLSSLLRPRNRRRRSDKSPYSSPFNSSPLAARNGQGNDYGEIPDEDYEGQDGGEDEVETPLLPIFSSQHLDSLPLYNITHSCRILIVQKCETTLTWEQLRSPQVSQFLVKPIQSQIRKDHFNRATICALVANCLQFQKECQQDPGNAGVSKTRAMISELLAMRLLKDFTIRELIDALSYDFDPLQGTGPSDPTPRQYSRVARISTVEIAIRAQAKRFLAHPLVIQQLEAIWAGTIVFHSAADNLHRKPSTPPPTRGRGYGTIENTTPPQQEHIFRRSVTLYNPKDASLFKLSRLRVPRYRQLFSTISFVIMLGLFLAILVDRSVEITPLEVIFWFWSAGYMLDELVGFSEQGFGLYIMSVWNALDLGILLLFFAYYVLRLYGILIPAARKHYTSHMAYDVLASTAVLLFPRAFSILDHYKYFSQLLIAFRLMVQDMVAILVLIVIACSGFFVAFTLSFSEEKADASKVAYALFQMIMGFTPAAWEVWPKYNLLGRFVLVGFLFLCHFLIVTILITVLTNSFMAIVQNANEEHQFLFAVNTISMVKSDALFSYIPPTNLLGWVAAPLRYIIPFRKFVKFNRTIIKVTHLPLLFSVFTYERLFLFRNAYTPLDLVERQGRDKSLMPAFALKNAGLFSPNNNTNRLREPSVVSFHKDRALEEVFRRPFDGTARTEGHNSNPDNRKATVVDHWMQEMGNEGGASPPMEQPRSVLERLENRRPGIRRAQTGVSNRLAPFKRDFSTASRSVVSDPEDTGSIIFPRLTPRIQEETDMELEREDMPQETDADGDDELVTNDGDNVTATGYDRTPTGTPDLLDRNGAEPTLEKATPKDYFDGAMRASSVSNATRARLLSGEIARREPHQRVASHNTIVYSPVLEQDYHSSSEAEVRRPSRPATSKHTNSGGTTTPLPAPIALPSGRKPPKPVIHTRPRPTTQYTAPDLHFARFGESSRRNHRQPSFNAIALDLASNLDDRDHRYVAEPLSPGYQPSIPASFSEQMLREREFAIEMERRRHEQRRRSEEEEKGMVGRIMLARMNTLEEGFREVLREVKDLVHTSRGTSEVGAGVSRSSLLPPSDGTATRPRTPVGRNSNGEKSKKSPKKGRREKGKGKNSVNSSSGEADPISPLTVMENEVLKSAAADAGAGKNNAEKK